MKIRWLDNCEISVVNNFDESTDQDENDFIAVKKGEIDEVDIIDDKGKTVDMQFGNGSVAYNVSKDCFEIIG